MQTFGKRSYAHNELDPWARKNKPSDENQRAGSLPSSRIAGYIIALATVGVIAVAGFEMLVMA